MQIIKRNMLAVFLSATALTGCGDAGGKDAIADKVEENADNRAEAMEAASESMDNALQQDITEQQANMVRAAGEERAEAIRNSQLDEDLLSNEQKNALVEGRK